MRLLELQKARDNASVLNDMLDNFKLNETSSDELSTIKDLYEFCKSLQPTILRLFQEVPENDDHFG